MLYRHLRIVLPALIAIFLPLTAFGFEIQFNEDTKIADGQVHDFETASLTYGISSFHYISEPVDKVLLVKPEDQSVNFSLVGVAEASATAAGPVIESYLRAQENIKSAARINDLESSVTTHYYQSLQAKVDEGFNSYVLLSMLQNTMPDSPKISDYLIEENHEIGRAHV